MEETKTINLEEQLVQKIGQLITECNQASNQVGHDAEAVKAIIKNLENSTEDKEVLAEVISDYKRQQKDIQRFLAENTARAQAAKNLKDGIESGNSETINLIINFSKAFGLI